MEIGIARRNFTKLCKNIEMLSDLKRVQATFEQWQGEQTDVDKMVKQQAEMRLDDRLLDDWAAYGAQVFGGICVLVGGTDRKSVV